MAIDINPLQYYSTTFIMVSGGVLVHMNGGKDSFRLSEWKTLNEKIHLASGVLMNYG